MLSTSEIFYKRKEPELNQHLLKFVPQKGGAGFNWKCKVLEKKKSSTFKSEDRVLILKG